MTKRLSEQTIDALLDKLGSDDNFRDRFKANPQAATAELKTNDEAVASLPTQPLPALASKQAFVASRARVRKQLVESAYPFQPITLDVPER